jgi:hypothetical protein
MFKGLVRAFTNLDDTAVLQEARTAPELAVRITVAFGVVNNLGAPLRGQVGGVSWKIGAVALYRVFRRMSVRPKELLGASTTSSSPKSDCMLSPLVFYALQDIRPCWRFLKLRNLLRYIFRLPRADRAEQGGRARVFLAWPS